MELIYLFRLTTCNGRISSGSAASFAIRVAMPYPLFFQEVGEAAVTLEQRHDRCSMIVMQESVNLVPITGVKCVWASLDRDTRT